MPRILSPALLARDDKSPLAPPPNRAERHMKTQSLGYHIFATTVALLLSGALSSCSTLQAINDSFQSSTPGAVGNKSEGGRKRTVIVYTNDSIEDAYRKVANILTDRGYSIVGSDATLGLLRTDFLRIAGGPYLSLDISIRKSQTTQIWIRGKSSSSPNGTNPTDVLSEGSSSTGRFLTWPEMKNVAQAYGGIDITYSVN